MYEIKHQSNLQYANFDHFGGYLLTGAGQQLNIFASRKWDEPAVYSNEKVHETGVVNVAKFSNSGKMIVSGGSEDRFMKVLSIA